MAKPAPSEQTELDLEIEDALGEPESDPAPIKYSITSYGADFDVRGLVQRLRQGDIEIPPFQRRYVWKQAQASRFIESLLLGLPVPGIFLSKEQQSQKLLVIDGQQRLLSLRRFYDCVWDEEKKTPFRLEQVQRSFLSKSYQELEEPDRRRLDNSIIHATIVKQDEPLDENSSIYQIFQRLNSGGTDLEAQEIRAALYHGSFELLLKELNDHPSWRLAFGAKSPRLKDTEMILRFFALAFDAKNYSRPMETFLNKYMAKNKDLQTQDANVLRAAFQPTIDLIVAAIGERAFRPKRNFNAAVFDSITVAIFRRLQNGKVTHPSQLRPKYDALLTDETYVQAISRSTADEKNVDDRLTMATEAFASVA